MTKHAFLSFEAEDRNLVGMFRDQVKDKDTGLSLVDHSVTQPFGSSFSPYIRSQVTQKIRSAPLTICLIGTRTANSPWVGWEIDTAVSLGRTLLGIRLHSDPTKDVPPPGLISADAKVVNWDIDDIVTFIHRSSGAARV